MSELVPDSNPVKVAEPPVLPETSELGLPSEFEIVECLGIGGMGIVYKARHRIIGAELAIKMLLPKHAENEKAVRRLVQEAQLLSKLSDPHIVAVRGCAVSVTGIPYIVMDFVPGRPLDVMLKEQGPLSVTEVEELLLECAQALGHAHNQGVVHRDLKPGNIMVNRSADGSVSFKLLDFGISKLFDGDKPDVRLTDTGQVMGTPLYMSPEHVTGEELDGRTDMYSLGCVAFETLTGQPPFCGTDSYKLLAQQVNEQPPRITDIRKDAPQGLSRIIERMMEKQRQDRYATMDGVVKDIEMLRQKGKVSSRLTGRQRHILRILRESLLVALIAFIVAYVAIMLLKNLH